MIPSLLLAPVVATAADPSTHAPINIPHYIFLAFAGLTVVGAISTIIRRNDVAAVMSLVASFFGLAGVYLFLSAPFIAVLQVLVYAGAIMVLFIFVVMVLNRDESEPWVWRGVVGKVLLGVVPIGGLTLYLCMYFTALEDRAQHPPMPSTEFGTVAQVGQLIFSDYLFAFEAVSVLLLIAVIAAVVVARATKTTDVHPDGPSPAPEHRFGDPLTGQTYAAVATPPGSGGGPH